MFQHEDAIYVKNRYDRMLAGEITVMVFDKDGDVVQVLGGYTLLPCMEELEDRHAVNLVLEDLLDLPQETLPPEWVESIPMEVVSVVQGKIDDKTKAINALEADVAKLMTQKAEIESHKRLLYESGHALEDAFARCLQMLGGEVTPAKYSQEEFILQYGGGIFLVECKGVGKSVALTHVRQLTDYMLKYEEDEGEAGKGILFGNAWKDLAPDERRKTETPIFPDNVTTRAKALAIALVASEGFFDVFCEFLAGRVKPEVILQRITSTVGIVDFSDLIIGGRNG